MTNAVTRAALALLERKRAVDAAHILSALPVPVVLPDDAHFLTRNFIVNIQQLKFAEPGLFSVDVRLDDESQAGIPLLVKLVERPAA